MAAKGLVGGKDAILTYPYESTQPHGKGWSSGDRSDLRGPAAPVIVKRNCTGEMEAEKLGHAVLADRMAHLDSVTVMFQRAQGYDPDHRNR